MMDDDPQAGQAGHARRLREQLDRELSAIGEPSLARERLLGEIAARADGAPSRREWIHRPAVLVPLAAAAVLVAVVVVPSSLRFDRHDGAPTALIPASSAPPASTAPSLRPTATPTPTSMTSTPASASAAPTPVPTVSTAPTAAAAQTGPSRATGPDPLNFSTSPAAPRTGEAVVLTVTGADDGPTELTVSWGDGNAVRPPVGNCARSVPAPASEQHRYDRPGRYTITVWLVRCAGTHRTTAQVPVVVRS